MKTILFINYGNNWIRGQELCLVNLLKNIDKAKYNPIVICNAAELKMLLDKIGVNTILTDLPEVSYDGKYTKVEIFRYIKKLVYIVKVVKKNNVKLIYSNSGLPAQLGYPLSRLFSIPLITHIHSPYDRRYAWMWFFKFSDIVIFVSNVTKNLMESKVRFRQTLLVYNGIDTNKFAPASSDNRSLRNSYGINDDEVVIGQIGSLITRKGVDLLLKSFAALTQKHVNIKLMIVGDGSERNALQDLSRDLLVDDRVIFVGDVTNTEVYYSRVFDINVLASRSEALPLTLLEAAACGLPNIGSRVGGIPEIIDNDITGYIFDKENVDQLSKSLDILIHNKRLREKMGEAGRNKIITTFSLKEYVSKIEKTINECLA